MGHTTAMFFRSLFGTIVLAGSIGLSNLPAVAQSPSRPGLLRDLNSIVEAKVLRVAVTRFDLPSFHVRGPDGTLVGPEIDMAQQIGRALGIRVEFVDNAESFDSVVDFVAAGSADIGVSKLSQTYNRLKRVRFSEPYVTLRHALLFNRVAIARAAGGRPPAAVLQKYQGRLSVIAGSAYVDFASQEFPRRDGGGGAELGCGDREFAERTGGRRLPRRIRDSACAQEQARAQRSIGLGGDCRSKSSSIHSHLRHLLQTSGVHQLSHRRDPRGIHTQGASQF